MIQRHYTSGYRLPGAICILIVCFLAYSCEVDKLPPENSNISINADETTTYLQTVQLSLSSEDNFAVYEMIISNNPDFSDAEWEEYTTDKAWILTEGYGEKTIYAKFRDIEYNESEIAIASIDFRPDPITFPKNPVIIINNSELQTYLQTVQLSISCEDDNAVVEMMISNNPAFAGASWEAFSDSKSWVVPEGSGNKSIYIRFRDAEKNLSEVAFSSIDYFEVLTLKVLPFDASLTLGEEKDVDIYLTGADQVVSVRITITFDPAVVEAADIELEGNGFLFSDAGANIITSESDMIDNGGGRITIGVLGQSSGFTGASGRGILAKIKFKGISEGSSQLKFENSRSDDLVVYKFAENEKGFENSEFKIIEGSITVQR